MLYIFSKENLTDDTVFSTMEYTMKLQEGNVLKYEVMYISQISELFVCDLTKASFEEIPISRAQCRRFYHEALRPETV